jgi:glucose-1-phosphate adenylyltransferase
VRVKSLASIGFSVLLPGVQVGRGARLQRVIVDRNAQIPPDLVVGEDAALDAERFVRTENGVTLITPAMLDRLSH